MTTQSTARTHSILKGLRRTNGKQAVQTALGLPAVQSVGLPATADQNTDGADPDEEDTGDGPPNGGEVQAPDEARAIEARAIDAALGARIRALTATRTAAPPSPEAPASLPAGSASICHPRLAWIRCRYHWSGT